MIESLQFEFFRNGLIGGVLASIACGIIGSYVVSKRIVFISGGISHACFGGIGIGYFLGFNPLFGALLFGVFSSFLMGEASLKAKEKEDTIIGVLWAVGMSLGIIFISLSKTYAPDLFSYLFGSILTITESDIKLMIFLDFFIFISVILFYKEFLAICFDEEFSRVRGLNVGFFYLFLLFLVALTTVLLLRVVGVILVIALLTIPSAIISQFFHSLKKIMLFSVLLGIFLMIAGLFLSYFLNLPSGATIVLLSSFCYLISLLLKR
ncbi:MAG: metal ABC transporter permease [Candidatus Omnitrophica bacterium]|nr:metal ABC transporter permease [Candidatus Omnitrophota bacterium]